MDLVILLSPTGVHALRANGEIETLARLPLLLIKRSAIPEQLIQGLIGDLVRKHHPRRVLLSSRKDCPYDVLTVPVFDCISGACDQADIPLIWIPDVYQLTEEAVNRRALNHHMPSS